MSSEERASRVKVSFRVAYGLLFLLFLAIFFLVVRGRLNLLVDNLNAERTLRYKDEPGEFNFRVWLHLLPAELTDNGRFQVQLKQISYNLYPRGQYNFEDLADDELCITSILVAEAQSGLPRFVLHAYPDVFSPDELMCGNAAGGTFTFDGNTYRKVIFESHNSPDLFLYPFDSFEIPLYLEIYYFWLEGRERHEQSTLDYGIPIIVNEENELALQLVLTETNDQTSLIEIPLIDKNEGIVVSIPVEGTLPLMPSAQDDINLRSFNTDTPTTYQFSIEGQGWHYTPNLTDYQYEFAGASGKNDFFVINLRRPHLLQAIPVVLCFLIAFFTGAMFILGDRSTIWEGVIGILFGIFGIRQVIVPGSIKVQTIWDYVIFGLYILLAFTFAAYWLMEWATNKPNRIKGPFVAGKTSRVFHQANCHWVSNIAPENLIEFDSYQSAIDAKLRPCATCFNSDPD